MASQLTYLFRTTPATTLVAKLYSFRRRSLWRYLMGALLLSLARPDLLGSFWPTLAGLALGFGLLGLAVVLGSSYWPSRQSQFEAQVTFQASRIVVQPTGGAPTETHDWRWVLRADEAGRYFFLTVRAFPRLILLLDKHRLSPEEAAAFRSWLAAAKLSA